MEASLYLKVICDMDVHNMFYSNNYDSILIQNSWTHSSTVVQLLIGVQLFATPWTAAYQASLSSLSPEFAQTHVHWASDATQPSYPLLSPSPAFNLSQHQGRFQWVGSWHQVVKVLELQLHEVTILPVNIQDWFHRYYRRKEIFKLSVKEI